jgi:hypothetical protein
MAHPQQQQQLQLQAGGRVPAGYMYGGGMPAPPPPPPSSAYGLPPSTGPYSGPQPMAMPMMGLQPPPQQYMPAALHMPPLPSGSMASAGIGGGGNGLLPALPLSSPLLATLTGPPAAASSSSVGVAAAGSSAGGAPLRQALPSLSAADLSSMDADAVGRAVRARFDQLMPLMRQVLSEYAASGSAPPQAAGSGSGSDRPARAMDVLVRAIADAKRMVAALPSGAISRNALSETFTILDTHLTKKRYATRPPPHTPHSTRGHPEPRSRG